MRWDPIAQARKNARVKRGFYLCSSCGETVTASIKIDGKRHKNVIVDHTIPIIDPAVGFTSWDAVIAAMFCEIENLKVVCKKCHDAKTAEERDIATARRRREKLK